MLEKPTETIPSSPTAAPVDPAAEYAARRDAATELWTRQRGLSNRLSLTRLAVFIILLATMWLSLESTLLAPAWIAVPMTAFVALIIWHRRVAATEERAGRQIKHYENGLARIQDRWMGHGSPGDQYRPADHPYADDLDILGRGSLFERISTARSRHGERALASWLLAGAETPTIRLRQRAVAELRSMLDLREQMALLGEDVAKAMDPDMLEAWATAPPRRLPRLASALATGLHLALGLSLGGLLVLGWSWVPLAAVTLAHTAFTMRAQTWVRLLTSGCHRNASELALMSRLLQVLELRLGRFDSELLRRMGRQLETEGRPPSACIARLETLVQLLDSRNNMVFMPIAMMMLWDHHLSLAIEKWRRRHGQSVITWFDVVGRFEALTSLACFAYESPEDTFPEIIDPRCPETFESDAGRSREGGSRRLDEVIEAEAMTHPLLPGSEAVRNDVSLGGSPSSHSAQVLIVSGSNMSGKSTFLRSLGVNAVLAMAGGAVRARRLTLPPVIIGAAIRKQDSLLDGRSGFFAEVGRLRQIARMCDEEQDDGRFVLFLLDEIFHGTNSHDRRIGAELVLRRFLDAGALGLVTTHDLALARLAETLAPAAANVHFEDSIADGQIHFDHRLRPGPVQRGNALALLRMVGLIDEPEPS